MNRAARRVCVCTALLAVAGPFVAVSAFGPVRDRDVVAELAPGPARLFVVVGTDSRQTIGASEGGTFGSRQAVTTPWADVVMLVRLDPHGGGARVLSLPRELLVNVDGDQKLGATLESGGPRAVVAAVTRATGLRPNHYVQLDFVAFASVVSRLGGVTVDVPVPARDTVTGLDLRGGPQRLDGDAALAYVRSRSYEEWRDGAWQPLDDGHLGRIERQHRLLRAIAAEGTQRRSLSPGTLWAARDIGRHVTVDTRLSIRGLVQLARSLAAARIEPGGITVLPSTPLVSDADLESPFAPGHVGGVSYLVADEPAAARALAAFRR